MVIKFFKGADPYHRDYGRQLCAAEWAELVGRTECANLIAQFMLEPIQQSKNKKKKMNNIVGTENFKQVCYYYFKCIYDWLSSDLSLTGLWI